MNQGYNKFKDTPDNHDFMTKEHIGTFLRNHRTGIDNLGRQALAQIIELYDCPTVLDAACGTCVNWEVFKLRGTRCKYTGVGS
jgi:ubiquinone/menaquinone biosynthesis C-methylase UbiE